MTLTRERPTTETPPIKRNVYPETPQRFGWLVVLVLAAIVAVTLILWLVPTDSESATPELGEPCTVQDFALAEDQLVRDPGLEAPAFDVYDLMTAEMELPLIP